MVQEGLHLPKFQSFVYGGMGDGPSVGADCTVLHCAARTARSTEEINSRCEEWFRACRIGKLEKGFVMTHGGHNPVQSAKWVQARTSHEPVASPPMVIALHLLGPTPVAVHLDLVRLSIWGRQLDFGLQGIEAGGLHQIKKYGLALVSSLQSH